MEKQSQKTIVNYSVQFDIKDSKKGPVLESCRLRRKVSCAEEEL